ncbi:MAG: hypothetical protein RLZZ360_943 [Candidatus Parcubacteria bacterium]|jgi:hypothetical protein
MIAPALHERHSPTTLIVLGSIEPSNPKWKWFLLEGRMPDGGLYLYWIRDDVAPGTLLTCIGGSVHHGLKNVYDIECMPTT